MKGRLTKETTVLFWSSRPTVRTCSSHDTVILEGHALMIGINVDPHPLALPAHVLGCFLATHGRCNQGLTRARLVPTHELLRWIDGPPSGRELRQFPSEWCQYHLLSCKVHCAFGTLAGLVREAQGEANRTCPGSDLLPPVVCGSSRWRRLVLAARGMIIGDCRSCRRGGPCACGQAWLCILSVGEHLVACRQGWTSRVSLGVAGGPYVCLSRALSHDGGATRIVIQCGGEMGKLL